MGCDIGSHGRPAEVVKWLTQINGDYDITKLVPTRHRIAYRDGRRDSERERRTVVCDVETINTRLDLLVGPLRLSSFVGIKPVAPLRGTPAMFHGEYMRTQRAVLSILACKLVCSALHRFP